MASVNPSESATAGAPADGIITLPPHHGALATDAARSVPQEMAPEQPGEDWIDKVDWVLLVLIVALAAVVSLVPAYNADVWLHLATGKAIVAGDYVPGGAEPFSSATEAAAGRPAVPWINHAWLYSLMLYVLYGAVGGMGVIIAKACIIGALAVVLSFIRSRDTHLFVVAVCLTLTVLALSLRLLLQPVIVSYLFLGVAMLILHRAGAWDNVAAIDVEPNRSRWLWALPVLCLVWVNCDDWFILGPIVVGLSWAGLAVYRARGARTRVTPGRLGIVFAACLAACLVNPYHVRAFQLPPELAYLVVRAGDRIGVSLPDALVGGGRTLSILHQDEPNLAITLSPFAPGYRSSPTLGRTVAGICFFPLLGLGLVSFVVNGYLSRRPGGPGLQPARFLVWSFFAVLASLLGRLMPFFVIVAGPILALNLGDLLAWNLRPSAGDPTMAWAAPVRLGRLVGVLVLAALLLLAWPGWLTGPQEIGGRLHAGWDVPVDESLRRAAEALAGPAEPAARPGAAARVLSVSADYSFAFPYYCAYFAGPGKAKGFVDGRYSLFPHVAADYVKARRALFDKRNKLTADADWTGMFATHGLDHAAVDNFMNSPAYKGWWAEPGWWRQRFADKTVAVFAWSGLQRRWPGDALLDDWNRLAFGPVPPAETPPDEAASEPQSRPLLDRYLEPPPPLPQAVFDIDVKLAYGAFVTGRATEIAQLTLPGAGRSQVPPMYSFPLLPLQPGAMIAPWAIAAELGVIHEARNQVLLWGALDPLPPAVPILALRRAWQAVAAGPNNERCYLYLATAVDRIHRQEDLWVNPFGGPPPVTLRSSARQIQLVAALRAATEIGFTNPALQYQVYLDLAQEFVKRHALDVAVEYLVLAEQALDSALPDDPRLQESWRKDKKQIGEFRKNIEPEVKRRKTSFDLKTAGRKPIEKVLEAVSGTYGFLGKDQTSQVDPEGWGLPGLALQLLDQIDTQTLPKEQQAQWGYLTIDLMFKLGRTRDAALALAQFEKFKQAPSAMPYRVYAAAAHGNYRDLKRVLEEGDELLKPQAERLRQVMLCSCAGLVAAPGPMAPSLTTADSLHHWQKIVNEWGRGANDAFNTRTFHGIVALEAGDTAEAQRLFAALLRDAGTDRFTERTIAERYAAFLARYQR